MPWVSVPGPGYRATATAAGQADAAAIAAAATASSPAVKIAEGLASPGPILANFTDHGPTWRPPNATPLSSQTGTSAGGAPGANFGTSVTSGAPVTSSTFPLLPLVIVGGLVAAVLFFVD